MKIALCIPAYGDTKSKFTQCLAKMIVHFLSVRLQDADGNEIPKEIEVFIVSTSMLTEGRHRLVAEALAWGADYMLFMDADHVFPEDALARLWSHGLPVVGVNYARRFSPTAPTAAVDSGDDDETKHLLYTTKEKAEDALVQQVAHMGFGLCLINMGIFDILQEKAEKDGDGNFLPLFQFTPTEDKIGMIGEDVFFFRKLADAGIKAFVDHGLSWEVGHLHEQILTNAHAIVQKDKWEAWRKARADKFADKAAEIEQACQ